MIKTVYIVGGNGFARECYLYVNENISRGENIKFGGFIGHNGYKVDFGSLNHFFVGDLSEIELGEDDLCVIGAGYPDLRKKIFEDIKDRGGQFYNLIVGGVLNEFVEIGEANVILNSFPSFSVTIGSGNVFNGDVIIGHDVQVGDFNFFGPHSQLLGNVKIGNGNTIGANAICLPKCKIGDNNKLSPLSVLYKGCRNNCYMHGNPALKIGGIKR